MNINFTEADGLKKGGMRTIVLQSLSDNYLETVIANSYYSVSDNRRTTGETKEATHGSLRATEECVPSTYEETKSVVRIEENKKTYEEERKDLEIPSIQSKTKQPMVREIDGSRTRAFYPCHELFEDSRAMLCVPCNDKKCRYCYSEYHGDTRCDEEVRRENIRRLWKPVSEELKPTGTLEDHLITCDSCKLNLFKDLDQDTISCFLCSKELKNFN